MNGAELYQYILDHTGHNLQGTWETTEQNQLKVTGTNVNGSYVVFNELGALNDFILEWEMTVLASAGTVRINSGISPILLTDPTGSSIEGWNNGTITNAKFVYFMCNYTGGGNVGTLNSISDNGSMSSVNSSTGSFTVGTKYTYKLVRADGYLRLYQDNNLISEYQETTYADTPFYLGWYMWYGGTYGGYQANFIIDNYVVTDLGTDATKYLNDTGLSEVWANIKNYISVQLLGKSDVGHTHSASEITDFPSLATVATSGSYNDLSNKPTIPTVNNATLTIQKNGTNVQTFTANQSTNATANIIVPTKVSELDNDSNYLTSVPNLDASKITSGTIDIARLPAGALESLPTNSTPFHNAYPRCKYLGTSITDAQNTAIKNRTYDDLFIGDYWTINGVNWRIVAIDYYYNVGDTNFDKGNLIVMPDTVLYSAQMNETNTTAGSYYGSLMRKQNLNSARTIAQNAFGSHLANHRIMLPNDLDHWYGSDGVELPNEVQIYGTRAWSSALRSFGGATQKYQFPLFALAPQFVNIRQNYWLQDTSSANYYSESNDFASVTAYGSAGISKASLSIGVRPSVTLSYI